MELATQRTHRAKGSVKRDELFKSWRGRSLIRQASASPVSSSTTVAGRSAHSAPARTATVPAPAAVLGAALQALDAPAGRPGIRIKLRERGTNATELIRPARAIAPIPNPYPAGHRSTRQDRIDGGLRISKMNSRKRDVRVYEGGGFSAPPQYASALLPLLKSKGHAARPMTWRRLWASPSAPRGPRV